MRYRLMIVILLVLLSLAEKNTPTSMAQGATYTDPFAYCAAIGAIDAPDARYVGPKVPEAIARGLRTATQAPSDAPLDRFVTGSSWRCMDGKVYACTVGANLPCWDKANTSQTPAPAVTSFCQTNPNGNIPLAVTGRTTVYEWSCKNGVATPGRQVWQVDARGFIANIWHVISPQAAAGSQMMPAAGSASAFADSTTVLLALGALAALLGLVVRRRSVVESSAT